MHQAAAVRPRRERAAFFAGRPVHKDAERPADITAVLFLGNTVLELNQRVEPALLFLAGHRVREPACRRSRPF